MSNEKKTTGSVCCACFVQDSVDGGKKLWNFMSVTFPLLGIFPISQYLSLQSYHLCYQILQLYGSVEGGGYFFYLHVLYCKLHNYEQQWYLTVLVHKHNCLLFGTPIDLFRQRSPSNGSGRNYGIGSGFLASYLTIENCLRNYWKLPSSFALIDVSLNSQAR